MDIKKVDGNLFMTRTSAFTCGENSLKNESFMLELICGPEKQAAFVDSYSDPCTMHIQLQTPMGCPVYSWTVLLHLIGAILVMIGLILTICGKFTQRWLLQVLIPMLIFISAVEICALKGYLS
jgi:membrane-associated HD superfamily phosphohydrolase